MALKYTLNNRSKKLSLGEKIVELRKEKGWSQDELAEKIGSDGRQISKYENNKITPSTEVLIKLARAFNTSLDYLAFDDMPKIPLTFKYNNLITKFEVLDELPEEDKKALLILIDAIIAKNKLKKLASSV